MIRFIREYLERRQQRKVVELKRRIAHRFNVRNTPQNVVSWREHGQWACPECGVVHKATGWSVWTGAQYPACCETPAGGRVYL